MSDVDDQRSERPEDRVNASDAGWTGRARAWASGAMASAKHPSEQHLLIAVPLRAAERNRRFASSVLAGGLAYRLFLWLLPFGLILGGALGFMNARSAEDAVNEGGLPAAVANSVGDAARSGGSTPWWLLAVGVPLLLWSGYTGAKAVQLVHSLVWDEPPTKTKALRASLAFTAVLCAVLVTIAVTWWFRDETWHGLIAAVVTIAPLAALWVWVSLRLPHGDATWPMLLPGALLVAVGVQLLHKTIIIFLVPKLESSTSLYGSLGAATTVIFFIYLCATILVTAPVLNSSLHDEMRARRAGHAPRPTEKDSDEDAGRETGSAGPLRDPSDREARPALSVVGAAQVRPDPGAAAHRETDDYKEHLRRLAVHDDALLEHVAVDGSAFEPSVLDELTESLVRFGAAVGVDAAPSSFQQFVATALACGATNDEIVASLEAVTPVTGAARVVGCVPKVALALGYDVEQGLELLDP